MPKLLQALGLKPPAGLVGAAPDVRRVASGDGDEVPPLAPPTAPSVSGGEAAVVADDGGAKAKGKGGDKPVVSPQKSAYDAERAIVVKLRSDLGKHKQAAHVADKTTQADAALAAAATHATTGTEWPAAMTELASAKTACTDGKGFADKFADFLVKRAEANLLLTAAQTSGWTFNAWVPALLASADTKAAPATRSYVAAKGDCDKLINAVTPAFKKAYVDDVKPKVAALKTLPAAKFIKAETDELDKMLLQQSAGITVKQWRQVRLNAGLIADRILMAGKIAARRAEFEAERPKADIAIKALAVHGKAIALPLAAIQQRLKEADEAGSKKGMQFEDAKAAVLGVVAACADLDRLARAAVVFTRDRAALAAELTTLRGHAAAAKITAELDVVRGLLDNAARTAGDKGAPGTVLALGADAAGHDFPSAGVLLAQARATLATARNLADGLDGVVAMEDVVNEKSNVTELRKGIETLAKELAAALGEPGADLAKVPFAAVQAGLDAAKQKIEAKKTDGVAGVLVAAGVQLTTGRRIQIEHRQFLERFKMLTQRLAQHNADKAQAAKLEIRLKELAKALADAEAAEAQPDHAKAIVELNKAETAAAAADDALVRRAAFDKDANLLQLDLEKPANASIKAAQAAEITRARAFAFVLDFASADKTLAGVRNAIGALEAEGMAKKTPPDPKLADKAKKLAEAGATKELDALIKSLPDTLDKQVFIDLAKARFKVEFVIDTDGGEQASMKRMCELMKDIPDDVIGNPSLKKITRRGAEAAPFYVASSNEVVMNSRPKAGNKADFPSAAGRLPDREEACKPKNNDAEDLFDFNMLHELAHAIDDAKNYMGTYGRQDDHGGWIEIGGNVDQIVTAVIKETGFGKEPEARQYVLDRILRNPALPPTAPFAGDKAKFEAFVTAAQSDGVWSSQAKSEAATLDGRVYQESYPNTWTSYKAEARKRGITGYQFRAPGEWFSELYAAWKRGKLKDEHPAVSWLKKLKV
jgi:hypothetical protein